MSTATTTDGLKAIPHGGKLVDLMLPASAHAALTADVDYTLQLTPRQLCYMELLMNGGFSPLTGFMNEASYSSVVERMRLPESAGNHLFGLPVVFDTDSEELQPGHKVLFKDGDRDIAVVKFTDKYLPNKVVETLECYGTSSIEHPGALMVATERGKYYMGGEVLGGLNLPVRDFVCATPKEVREVLRNSLLKNTLEGQTNTNGQTTQTTTQTDVVAFQCRNPIHRAHYELFTRALDAPNLDSGSVVLVHPTCGPTQADDISGTTRYKTYEVLKEETHNPRTIWAYLPYSMHMAGPREAVQHAMIRKNYGCTAFIIGRDMAGSKSSISGDDYYGAYDARDKLMEVSEELGVKAVPSLNLVYTEEEGYVTADYAEEKKLTKKSLSGTKFRKALRAGEDIPEWFAFPSVVKVLRENI